MTPYAKYQDDVLARYAGWVRNRVEKGVTTIDVQEPIATFVRDQRVRYKNPEFRRRALGRSAASTLPCLVGGIRLPLFCPQHRQTPS